MSVNHRVSFSSLFKILLTVSLIVTAVCLMWGAYSIYTSADDNPYTRAVVAQTFQKIAVPVFVSLALIALNAVLYFFDTEKKPRFKINSRNLCLALSKKRDIFSDEKLYENIRAERKKRRLFFAVASGVYGALSGVFFSYALNSSNFHRSDINSSMIKAMAVLTPCLIVAFAVGIILNLLVEKSLKKEIELLKEAPKAVENEDEKADRIHRYEKDQKRLFAVKIVLFFFFAAVAVFGFISGGTADVLTKAVNICTECIGLG